MRTKEIAINEKLGDFFIDIAKLVFAGVVLSALLDITDSKAIILITGVCSTMILVMIGFTMYKINNKKR